MNLFDNLYDLFFTDTVQQDTTDSEYINPEGTPQYALEKEVVDSGYLSWFEKTLNEQFIEDIEQTSP